jgi:3-deoxy-7-phosphoheptulonate synthase
MIVVMAPDATKGQINDVIARVKEVGLSGHLIEGEERTIVGVVGLPLPPTLDEMLELQPGVVQVIRVTSKFKLTSWDFHPQKTKIRIGATLPGAGEGGAQRREGVTIGGEAVTVIAGPCSVESEEQTLATAQAVHAAGATLLRGGAYKPRTSPYEFRGLGQRGLEILALAREETGLGIITEVMTPADVATVHPYTDIFQIGARNSQNYLLLEEVGKAGKPVMLKRGLSMLIEEWLLAAEYVMAQGNPEVILCERGIRTFETQTRNTLDVSAVPVVQKLSHLPVFVDPSHAAGKRAYIEALSLAGVAAGCDGLMIEVHPSPDHALSDGAQSLTFAEFAALMPKVRSVAEAVGRELPTIAEQPTV